MPEDAKPTMYHIYHEYDGKMVMDMAESWERVQAHYAGDPKFKNHSIAGLLEPMTAETQKRYEDYFELKHDSSKRPDLKPAPAIAVRQRKAFSVRTRANRRS